MADNRKNIPDAGKVDKPPKPGKVEPAKATPSVQDQPAREGAAKSTPPKKAAAPDKSKQTDKAKDAAKPRRGRPPKADKAAPDKAKPQPRDKMFQTNCCLS